VTEQRDWPPEQSAKGTLRPWHSTAAGYLAVLFEDPEEAQRAQRGLWERGVPEGDLRLYDGEETLRIASRLQQERSILAKAIKEIEVDHRAEKRWLAALVARQDKEVR
jgi:histidinol-phosphate/aromatic aminotransferase/cobyric acid decarboxylase-like protein